MISHGIGAKRPKILTLHQNTNKIGVSATYGIKITEFPVIWREAPKNFDDFIHLGIKTVDIITHSALSAENFDVFIPFYSKNHYKAFQNADQ